jgi:hypothetical protein
VKALRRARDAGWPIRIEGDMNSARRTMREAGLAAATGINPGAADLRVFLPAGKLFMIENKRLDAKGKATKRSKEQVAAHDEFARLGHDIVTLTPASEDDAAEMALAAVALRLGLPIPILTFDVKHT